MTLEVYGHVVATDVFGDAYVIPLNSIFADIQRTLGVQSVNLPSTPDFAAKLNATEALLQSSKDSPEFQIGANMKTLTHYTGDPASDQRISSPKLVCEFLEPLRCAATFDLNDVKGWIRHNEEHFPHTYYPTLTRCWFCFRAFSGTGEEESKGREYERRMHHIAAHFRNGGSIENRCQDLYFLDHMCANGIIDHHEYKRARRVYESQEARLLPSASVVPPISEEDFWYMNSLSERPRQGQFRQEQVWPPETWRDDRKVILPDEPDSE